MVQWHKIEGLSDYSNTLDFMESVTDQVINKEASNIIILTEHVDIITGGTSSKDADILVNTNIPILKTGRGGQFTFHGKGQRVIYPIIDLKENPWQQDLKKYINFLHVWVIRTLEKFSIKSYTRADHIGVWTKKNGQDAKIAAIGIRARKWVTYHGVAVNLNTDLTKFKSFVPCGISKFDVTSAKDLGHEISMEEFDKELQKIFEELVSEDSLRL